MYTYRELVLNTGQQFYVSGRELNILLGQIEYAGGKYIIDEEVYTGMYIVSII